MKKLIILLFACVTLSGMEAVAQIREIDSLKNLLASTKEDTVKIKALVKLSFYDQDFQRGLDLANEALALSRKINWESGEARALHQIGNQYHFISNFPLALHYFLGALKIRERIKDSIGLAMTYGNIGMIYSTQGDYKNALKYYVKGAPLNGASNYIQAAYQGNLGSVYFGMRKLDSALMHYQRAYEYGTAAKDKYQFNITLIGLGNVHLKLGNTDLALQFYRQAIPNGILYSDTNVLSTTHLAIAELYEQIGKPDSSIFYALRALRDAQQVHNLGVVIVSSKLLSKLYESIDVSASLRYLKLSQETNDSLFSQDRVTQIQNMFYNETEREREMAEQEKILATERKQYIEFSVIGIGIISLLILFLLLSRTIIVKPGLVKAFGIIGLLITFEFFNLLLHPFLEKITDHSPIWMLLCLAAIAGILIPLHHWLEKWITTKLVEKNEKIRLAAAKKIIEEAEKQQQA